MNLTRYFYISGDLDDLEACEHDLEVAGFVKPQIHLLTDRQTAADEHAGLHKVNSLMRSSLIHFTLVGACIGSAAFVMMLIIPWLAGATDSAVGWMPFIFLAVVLLGFCTWLGGLYGIQKPHAMLRPFHRALHQGRHVLFVDTDAGHSQLLGTVAKRHASLTAAGQARGAPNWIVFPQHRAKRFFSETFP